MSLNDFVILEKVGSGSFASVYKARRLIDQKIYALKKIDLKALSQKEKNNALNQIRLLACLKSPFIIGYCESFFDQKLDILCIAMEYADSGDLLKKIENHKKQKTLIPEIEIWKVCIHLLYGLNELHSRSILHRDLKSQNVFIARQTYKIGDMNVSKIVKNGRLAQTQTGTPYYASPQVWNDQPYNEKSDIWSLGCILHEISALRPPFSAKSMDKLFEQVNKAQIPRIPKNYSKQLQSLIDQCLQKNPFLRPSTKSLLQNQTVKNYENMLIEYKPNLDNHQKGNMLLKTIYMPASKKQLNDKLPHSNYKSDKIEEKKKEISKEITKINVQQKNQQIKQIENTIQPVFSNIENLINQRKTEKKTKNKSNNKNSSRSKERSKGKVKESSSINKKKVHSCRIFKGKQNNNIPSIKDLNKRENLIARAQMVINSHKIDKTKTPPKKFFIQNEIIDNKAVINETVSKQLKPKKLVFEEQTKQKQDKILSKHSENSQEKLKESQKKKLPQDISKSPYLGQTIRNQSNISVSNHEYYNFHVQKDQKIISVSYQPINIMVDIHENYQKISPQNKNKQKEMSKIDSVLGIEKLNSFYSKFIRKASIFFMNKMKRQTVIYKLIQGNQQTLKKNQYENAGIQKQKLASQNEKPQTSAKKEEIKRNRSRSIPRLEKPRQKNTECQQLYNFLLNKMSEKNLVMNQQKLINQGRKQEKLNENCYRDQNQDKKIKQMLLLPPKSINSVKKDQKDNQIAFKDLPHYNQTDKKYIRHPLTDKNTYNMLLSNQKSNKKIFPEKIFSQGPIQFEQKKKRLFQSIQTSNNLVHSLNDKLDRLDLERRMKKYMNV